MNVNDSGKADGLAGWFVLQWALGDSCNLIGCLFTGQQAITETYTAVYFIFCDILMGSQYLYLRWRSRKERRLRRMIKKSFYSNAKKKDNGDGDMQNDDFTNSNNNTKSRNKNKRVRKDNVGHGFERNGFTAINDNDECDECDDDDDDGASSTSSSNSSISFSRPVGAAATIISTSLCVMTTKSYVDPRVSEAFTKVGNWGGDKANLVGGFARRHLLRNSLPCAEPQQNRIGFIIAGQTFGYISVLFYIGSRFAQIHRNYKRKSVEGLSTTMFVFAVMANLTYAAAIILAGRAQATLFSRLPWLLGSLGTVALDFIIFTQSCLYGDDPCDYNSASEATTSAQTTPGGAMSRSASTESTALLIKSREGSIHNGSRVYGGSNTNPQPKYSPILFSPQSNPKSTTMQYSPNTVIYDPLVSSSETTATDESA